MNLHKFITRIKMSLNMHYLVSSCAKSLNKHWWHVFTHCSFVSDAVLNISISLARIFVFSLSSAPTWPSRRIWACVLLRSAFTICAQTDTHTQITHASTHIIATCTLCYKVWFSWLKYLQCLTCSYRKKINEQFEFLSLYLNSLIFQNYSIGNLNA